MRPMTYRIPKPLIPVMGKPLIVHVIDSLPKEVDEIIVPIGYKMKMMEEYLHAHRPSHKVTLVEEQEPLGTGGAVKNVEGHIDGQFLVINGDSISSLDFARFLDFHRRKKGVASISLWPVEDPTPYGVVDLDEEQRIRRFQEKPKKEEAFSNLINAGAYALEYEVLDQIGKGFVSMEREVFPKLLDKGMYGMRFDGYWIDCGRREDLLRAFWTLMGPDMGEKAEKSVSDGARLVRPFAIKEMAVVTGATVGPRAYVSERAVVGLRSHVENSVLMEDARVGAGCTILDSVIDAGVSLPDGSRVESRIVSNAKDAGQ